MAFKEQLGEALVKAVDYFNKGRDPNEAIVKSAQEMGFNLDQTDRLVEKFNTARTINYFERHPEDRTQNFSIASKEKVAECLFGDKTEKKASAGAYTDEWYDYTSYDRREADYFTTSEKVAEQVSSRNEDLEGRHDTKGYSIDSLHDLILKRASDHDAYAKYIRDQLGMISSEITSELSKIASSLVSGYDPEERYAVFKTTCKSPMFASLDGLVPDHVKKASAAYEKKLRRLNIVELGDMKPLADSLSKLAEASARATEFEKEAEQHEACSRNIRERLMKIPAGKKDKNSNPDPYNEMRDFLRLGSDTIVSPAKDMLGSANKATDMVVGKGLSEYMDTGFLGSKEDIQKVLTPPKKKDTSIAEHINNLRRSTILQDLYENDPILSEADPVALADAYKTVVQTAPEMSLNKEIVRAILRQSVNSMAVSPFDAKQWADLENVLGKNRSLGKDQK